MEADAAGSDLKANATAIALAALSRHQQQLAIAPVDLARPEQRLAQDRELLSALLDDRQHHPVATTAALRQIARWGDAQRRRRDQAVFAGRHETLGLADDFEGNAITGHRPSGDDHAPVGKTSERLALRDQLIDDQLGALRARWNPPTHRDTLHETRAPAFRGETARAAATAGARV